MLKQTISNHKTQQSNDFYGHSAVLIGQCLVQSPSEIFPPAVDEKLEEKLTRQEQAMRDLGTLS